MRVKNDGMSISQACAKVGIKYSTGRDIMQSYRKRGMPYRSDFDKERMQYTPDSKEKRQLVVQIEVPNKSEPQT